MCSPAQDVCLIAADPAVATQSMAIARMTRRSILIGAVASLICTSAIVRATSPMPVRGLPLQPLNPLGEFYRRCFYHSLNRNLAAGRMSTVGGGTIIPPAEVRLMVAYARSTAPTLR